MNDAQYLGTAFAVFAFLAYKLRVLRHTPPDRKPTIRPVCATALLGGLAFFFAAPTVAVNLDHLVQIPNFATLLVHVTGTASVCTIRMMVLYWYYPRERAWRASRWWILGNGLVNTTLVVLFMAGPRIAEYRNIEFPTAAARVPYLREYVLLYLATWIVAECNGALLCMRFASETPADQPRVRRGLRIVAFGFALMMTYLLIVVGAVVARWFDIDLDYWSVRVAPTILSLGGVVATLGVGFVPVASRLDSAKQWLLSHGASVRNYRALRPLWHALRPIDPGMVHKPETLRERFSIESRLFWRVIEINDWLHQIRAHGEPSATGTGATKGMFATPDLTRIRTAALAMTSGSDAAQTSIAEPGGDPSETANAFTSELTHLLALARVFAEDRSTTAITSA
ncbi:MAG: hypothetical protein JOZ47_13195 [Kutzneria sp.]|nr:hypothetical protein [Kutzneria sp.]MBV9846012.1 hypothetical protein [Kutzneria sp.]